MEKKIEITEPVKNVVNFYECEVRVDGENPFDSYGRTPEEAQQNARIAASGYLVEELVEGLELMKIVSNYHEAKEMFGNIPTHWTNKLDNLLTKAKTL